MRFNRVICALIVTGMLVSACGGTRFKSNAEMTVLAATELPVPQRDDLVAPGRDNLIGPLDTLGIEVFGVADLTREVQVDAGGRVQFPLLGTINAAGQTTDELGTYIRDRLTGRYVKKPQVIVNLTRSVSQVVTIDGQVAHPGAYPVTNQTTLLRAVALAEGLSEFAREDEVVILRTVGTKRMAGLYSLNAIRQGNYSDPKIYANDMVYVGDSPARRFFKNVLAAAPLYVTPIVALIQR